MLQDCDIRILHDVIGSPIIIYIPTIGCADRELEIQVEHGLSVIVDRAVELFITETSSMAVRLVVVSVKTLRSYSDSINS